MLLKDARIGMEVINLKIYYGNEVFKISGIKSDPDLIEIRGDFSGGTHCVDQREWYPAHEIIQHSDDRKRHIVAQF